MVNGDIRYDTINIYIVITFAHFYGVVVCVDDRPPHFTVQIPPLKMYIGTNGTVVIYVFTIKVYTTE